MTPSEVLSSLHSLGLQFSATLDGKLKVSGTVGVITPELREEIKRNREQIVDSLQEFWANIKLELWEKYGARLFQEDLLKNDPLMQKECERWEYANKFVLLEVERQKQIEGAKHAKK